MLDKLKINSPMRMFLLVFSGLIWLGMWLSGFGNIHWLLYIPATFGVLAGITGFCPGMMFSRMITGKS